MATKKIPRLLSDDIEELSRIKKELNDIKISMTKEILENWHNDWLFRGGCIKCQGREKILCSSSLKILSCPDCTELSKNIGLNLSFYDSMLDTKIGLSDPRNDIFGNIFENIDSLLIKTISQIKENEYKKSFINRGDIVCVIKGRKVPIGFVGKVSSTKPIGTTFNSFFKAYGNIELKSMDNVVQWVNINNIEKISDQSLF